MGYNRFVVDSWPIFASAIGLAFAALLLSLTRWETAALFAVCGLPAAVWLRSRIGDAEEDYVGNTVFTIGIVLGMSVAKLIYGDLGWDLARVAIIAVYAALFWGAAKLFEIVTRKRT